MSKRTCSSCRSSRVVCWGHNASGSQRFRCPNCGISQTLKRRDSVQRNRFSWLTYWLGGSTVAAIARSSRRSKKTIKRSIHWFLDHPPIPKPQPNSHCRLIIDATWFKRNHCLIVYWDHDRQNVQRWRYTTSENGVEITQDLRWLQDRGVLCASITSDGGTGLNTAVNLVYPDIPHQRCVVHVQRQGLAWLTRNPKTIPGQQLKPFIQQLSTIETSARPSMDKCDMGLGAALESFSETANVLPGDETLVVHPSIITKSQGFSDPCHPSFIPLPG